MSTQNPPRVRTPSVTATQDAATARGPLPVPPELTAEHWDRASAHLAAKMLAELCFEYALRPDPDGPGRWRARACPSRAPAGAA